MGLVLETLSRAGDDAGGRVSVSETIVCNREICFGQVVKVFDAEKDLTEKLGKPLLLIENTRKGRHRKTVAS